MTGRLDLLGIGLLIAAVVIGIWIGLSGPDISPIISEAPFAGGGAPGVRR